MWWLISVFSWGLALIVLGAGLLWPWLRARSDSNREMWLAPWWRFWLTLCTPFLSWRYRWYLEGLFSYQVEKKRSTESFFALQCLIFFSVFGLGVIWVVVTQSSWQSGAFWVSGALLAFSWPIVRIKQEKRRLQQQMQRDFPFMLDLLCLSVESGHGLQQALWLCSTELQAGPLRAHLIKIQESMRAGLSREQALEQFAQQVAIDEARAFVAALQQSIELGGRLAPMLRQQAQQRRQERFLRAEKHALEAPVKMLAPLVLCIFPCTFLVIAYPLFFQLWQQL